MIITRENEAVDMAAVHDTHDKNMKYKHELSGDIRDGEGMIEKKKKILGYTIYQLEKYGEIQLY